MTNTVPHHNKVAFSGLPLGPSVEASNESRQIQQDIYMLSRPTSSQEGAVTTEPASLEEALFVSRAQFKILVSQIAMHLDTQWRSKLFDQIDSLLDQDEWLDDDVPPTLASCRTIIRALLLLDPKRKPGLGASHDGHVIAAWTTDHNLLTLECCPKDYVQWSLVRETGEGEQPERAVGKCKVDRLPNILAPYQPRIWFEYGHEHN